MNHIIFVLCFLATFVCGFFNENANYPFLFLLPFSLMIFIAICNFNFEETKKSYVYYIFSFQAFIRYCIIPVGIALGNTIHEGDNSVNINSAIFYMIIELSFIFFLFLYQNYKVQKTIYRNKIKLVSKNIWLYLIVAIFFLIILRSGFFNKVNFIWNLSNFVENITSNEKDVEYSSLGGLLFIPFKISLMLIIASVILETNRISNIYKMLMLFLLMVISSSFIVGMSRLSILTFILPFYFIILSIQAKKMKRMFSVGLLILIVPVTIATSIDKFSRGDRIITTKDIIDTNSLNAYFSGVRNIVIGIDAFEEHDDKNYISFLLNDLFQNVPIVSKLTDNSYKSNIVFNKKYFGHSEWQTQIVPLSIAGLFHFNIFGVGLYSCLFLLLAFFFEKKAKQASYLPYKYIFYNLTLILSMVFMLNIGSMIASIFRSLIFVYLPFYITDKLYKLRKI